jgi:ArsR family transcriptional regulator, arsenate/arsenite/antimonite-responsive transcriptional repressor
VREENLGVVAENGRAAGDVYDDARVGRLVALGGALSDPIRVRMLGMMAGGRGCCSLPDCGVPAADQDAGICICEFEAFFGMGQSKVSYHMKKLKGAGLVHEERRGRWSFYSLSRDAARGLLAETAEHLGMAREVQDA